MRLNGAEELNELLTLLSRAVSMLVVLLLAYGLWNRRRPKVHIPVMVICFVVDVINVLVIEISRLATGREGAVSISVHSLFGNGHWLLNFHIAVSVLILLCYATALISGTRLYRKQRACRAQG